ncbi:hypothetical protein EAI_06573 [Harpegnathos saltator]|uniref:Uncharacterized protein n=1 Tax=Harpegnathos saltator TaxID=610380 RepID=E2BL03_HARSA|nr:hypothetical protein EAI_06573 [Harpegnathos saltator]
MWEQLLEDPETPPSTEAADEKSWKDAAPRLNTTELPPLAPLSRITIEGATKAAASTSAKMLR